MKALQLSGRSTERVSGADGTSALQRRVATAAIAGALVVLALVAGLCYQGVLRQQERLRAIVQAHDALVQLQEASAAHRRARGAWEAYASAGDPSSLAQFEAAVRETGARMAQLEVAIDGAEQRVRLLSLDRLMQDDLAGLRAGARGGSGPASDEERASALRLAGIGELLTALADAERERLRRNQTEAEAAAASLQTLIVAGFGICLLVLILALMYLDRTARAHRAIQRRVMDLNRALEKRAEALQAINKELEDFSYSVSHDLRAPVRAISSFAHILEEEYGAALDAEGRRLLGVVRGNAERMGRLIDDLLAFSRVGRQALHREPVDMKALVEEVIAAFRADSRDTLRARFEVGDLPQAFGDAALLRQVWANLIDNALKYSGKAEQPVIRIFGGVQDDGWAAYTIEDNGVGFDMRYAGKLFEVFQRLHQGQEFPGTGVGLAIVKRIVDRHGGRVRAEGAPNQGARFSFLLPLDADGNEA